MIKSHSVLEKPYTINHENAKSYTILVYTTHVYRTGNSSRLWGVWQIDFFTTQGGLFSGRDNLKCASEKPLVNRRNFKLRITERKRCFCCGISRTYNEIDSKKYTQNNQCMGATNSAKACLTYKTNNDELLVYRHRNE